MSAEEEHKQPAVIEAKLKSLGLTLPEQTKVPVGTKTPFTWVRVHGNRAYVSGHLPQNPDGSIAEPIGKVGKEVSLDQGYQAARLAALSVLSSLKSALGSLDRVTAWLTVRGMVNAAPDFVRTGDVINGFSDLILELYGPEVGRHARSTIGAAQLPFEVPVVVEAIVEISRLKRSRGK